MSEYNGIAFDQNLITTFCRKYHIRRMGLFGSILRTDFGPNSDIDILVEFDSDHIPGFFKLIRLEDEMSKMFDGRRVEIRTPNDLSKYFRDEVVNTAEVLFAGS